MASARVLAIWCMDWPAVAAAAAAGLSATAPVAVTLANRVIACSATARAAGVRRGLRRREAAARCPQLFIATADADRDARLFEGVIAAVDDLVPRAELLRPGLLVLPVRGPARFFGSEQMAAERLIDAVAAAGAECQVGIADRLSTAVFAARAGRIVEPGGDARFLSLLSIRQLATEPSLSGPGRDDLTDLLWRMGIRTIGQFAALSRLLGPEAVRVPVLSGGHGPAERITLTVLGLVAPEPVPQADPGQPWPGRLPDPSPAVLFDDPVDLLDAQGNPIRVTSRGMFSADPARLRVRGRDDRLRWWAGPWPDDERWWDPDRASGRTARAQVLLDGDPGTALLLCYRQRRWYLEGSYE